MKSIKTLGLAAVVAFGMSTVAQAAQNTEDHFKAFLGQNSTSMTPVQLHARDKGCFDALVSLTAMDGEFQQNVTVLTDHGCIFDRVTLANNEITEVKNYDIRTGDIVLNKGYVDGFDDIEPLKEISDGFLNEYVAAYNKVNTDLIEKGYVTPLDRAKIESLSWKGNEVAHNTFLTKLNDLTLTKAIEERIVLGSVVELEGIIYTTGKKAWKEPDSIGHLWLGRFDVDCEGVKACVIDNENMMEELRIKVDNATSALR